ncbi:MAG: calcium-binding protein [Pseudomonadota bacterium]
MAVLRSKDGFPYALDTSFLGVLGGFSTSVIDFSSQTRINVVMSDGVQAVLRGTFSYDPIGGFATSGTISKIILRDNGGGTQLFDGVNFDVAAFVSAAATQSRIDDASLFSRALNGADMITGTALDDIVSSGRGNDTIRGGAGNDDILSGADDDRVFGEAGNDSLNGKNGDDLLVGGAGEDSLIGGHGNDKVRGGSGNDYVRGGADDDRVNGQSGDDSVFGGTGDDHLLGGAGNDTLFGQDQDDSLEGGLGVDRLVGGPGSDQFIFKQGNSEGRDVIVDFVSGVDQLVLVGFGMSITSINSTNGQLQVDMDGDISNGYDIELITNRDDILLTDIVLL